MSFTIYGWEKAGGGVYVCVAVNYCGLSTLGSSLLFFLDEQYWVSDPNRIHQNCWSAAQSGAVLINAFPPPPLMANECGTKMGAGKDKHMYSDCSEQLQGNSQHSLGKLLPLEGVSTVMGDGWQQYLLGLLPKARIA